MQILAQAVAEAHADSDEGRAMTRSVTRPRTPILASLLLAMAMVVAAAVASAEVTVWDQEKVTAIAGELVEATRDLRSAVRKQPSPQLGQPGRAAFFRLRDDLSAIETTAGRLHRALSQGAGHDETFPTYRRMIRSVRSASDELRRIQIQEPVKSRLETAADALRRLRPYYEEAPPI